VSVIYSSAEQEAHAIAIAESVAVRAGIPSQAKQERSSQTKTPTNNDELKAYLLAEFNIRIPDTQVCPNHCTPFRAFADAYFARHNVTIWEGSRGFAGKSYLLALLGHVEADTLGAEVTILGGSGEQSTRVIEYLQKWSSGEENIQRRTRYRSGGLVTALMASSKSARGPHPQRMRLDEVDEMDLAILDAAMGQPMGTPKVAKQTVMSSTHHYAAGTFTEIKKRAEEKGWPLYEWCYKETSAQPEGWLSLEEIDSKRGEVTASMWQAEYDLQEPSPEDRAILPERVDLCFQSELGVFEGRLGDPIEIEPPDPDAKYATGADWAKKKDFTVIDTFRIDVRPMRRVAWVRLGRMPWPMMIAKFDARVQRYPGASCHDATGLGDVVGDYQAVNAEGVVLSGQVRSDVFTKYIAAIEGGHVVSPKIRYCEGEHRYCTNDDLAGSGHPPDSFVAGAMAYKAASIKEIEDLDQDVALDIDDYRGRG
jgi:hypothetical protein